MLSKAKTLTGEWVKGYYSRMKNSAWIEGLNNPYCLHKINPSTLCQQVPTKDWFVGDELVSGGLKGFVYFHQELLQYRIQEEYGKFDYSLYSHNWKPTGKNKYDDE